jgi:hypothetical protein
MIYQYVVTLKNDKQRLIDLIGLFIASVSAIAFLTVFVRFERTSYIFLAGFILIVAGLIYNWYRRKKHSDTSFSRVLLVAGIIWFAMPHHFGWIGLPILLLALLEPHARRPLEIGFSDDRVVINSLIRKKFQWEEFSNVMLKDDMLTLDFKNNRIIQKETIDEEGDTDEEEFNDYCRGRLKTIL